MDRWTRRGRTGEHPIHRAAEARGPIPGDPLSPRRQLAGEAYFHDSGPLFHAPEHSEDPPDQALGNRKPRYDPPPRAGGPPGLPPRADPFPHPRGERGTPLTRAGPGRAPLPEEKHISGDKEAGLLLRGTVRDSEGKGLKAGVAVYQSEEGRWEKPGNPCLARKKTREDGSFSLRIRSKKGCKVDILAVCNGYKPEWKRGLSLEPFPGKIEFVLTRGESIAGRILTISGKPLVGILVLACDARFTSRPRTFVSSNMLERAFEKTPDLWKKGYHQAFSITDEDGRFRIQGLKDGDYSILLKSYRWILDPPIRAQAGTSNVKGIAKKALFLKARVLDAETSKPVKFIIFDVQIEDREAGKKFEISGGCLNGELLVGWVPGWKFSKTPFPVLVSLFSPDYFQQRETLYLREETVGPPPTILVKPIHRVPILFKALYKDGTPLEYPVLMVDFWKPGGRPPKGRAQARRVGKGLFQVKLPEGRDEVRVFRPRMTIQWPRKSQPSGKWDVPAETPYEVVFSKGATLFLHLSPETVDSVEKGRMTLLIEGSRKKKKIMEFGSQISSKKIINGTFTMRDVPPGIYVRFSLKESIDNDQSIRTSRLLWIEEGSKVDFFL